MQERFLDFIEKQALIGTSDRVLLAVSGGLDSMAMLHLFSQTNFPFAVAHCNFCLRGQESDGDESFVKDRAEALGVPFFLTKFDTKLYASTHQCSIQMAARDLRYAWFEELMEAEGYQKIATAHHLNDSLETTLFNLAKGTSIAGLRGILPKRDDLIRPLLDFKREELEAMMKQEGLSWREDSSNQDTHYQRNFIRAKVVEPLMHINPDLLSTFKETAARNREVEGVFSRAMEELQEKSIQVKEGHLLLAKNAASGPYVLEQLLKPYGFGYGLTKEVWVAREGLSGSRFLSDTHTLVVDREHFVITENKESTSVKALVEKGTELVSIEGENFYAQVVDAEALQPDWKQEANALLDMDKLTFPLTVRPWQEGDSFHPLGMKGKKKLSDFMIDRKIPVNLKSRLRVVESAGDIVWVVGLRIDDRFKVTNHSKKIFCLINSSIHV